jgi:cytochrome c peroxidase
MTEVARKIPAMKIRRWLLISWSCLGVFVGGVAGCSQPATPPTNSAGAQPPSAAESDPVNKPAAKNAAETEDANDEHATVAATAAADKDEAKPARITLGVSKLTSGIPGEGPLDVADIKAWLDDSSNHEIIADFDLPPGMATGRQQVKGLDANPLTRAKIELGRQLYFDPRLSADGTISCASCHDPDHGYAADTRFGVGIGGQMGGRNSPVAYNRILSDKQFWDGRAASLEDQAKGPIANPIEMGNTHEACVKTLAEIEGYKLQFEKIFGELTIDAVAQAIASFERVLVTGPAPADYYEQFRPFADIDPEDLEEDPDQLAAYKKAKAEMEAHPMSESAQRGRELFYGSKGSCTACHVGPNLSDELYHNLGVGMEAAEPDLGRYSVTMDEKDRGAFKTPTVRNVTLTAPYMHDGSLKTLEEVVEWYDKGGHPNPQLDPKIKKLNLTDQEQADLVAFMKACESEFPVVRQARLPK